MRSVICVVLPEEELPSPKPIDYSARTWSVEKLAQFCCARQVNDRDFTIVATGTKGAGKSTLMYKLAKRIGEINGAGFSLQKNISRSRLMRLRSVQPW
jgi:adenylylsulfate kinase-like enzyme